MIVSRLFELIKYTFVSIQTCSKDNASVINGTCSARFHNNDNQRWLTKSYSASSARCSSGLPGVAAHSMICGAAAAAPRATRAAAALQQRVSGTDNYVWQTPATWPVKVVAHKSSYEKTVCRGILTGNACRARHQVQMHVLFVFVKPAQPCGSRCARPGGTLHTVQAIRASRAAREGLYWFSNVCICLACCAQHGPLGVRVALTRALRARSVHVRKHLVG